MRFVLLTFLVFFFSQASLSAQEKRDFFIDFPAMEKGKAFSLGLSFFTTPRALTEEVHTRIPAGDFRITKGFGKGNDAVLRLRFQGIQNELILGYRRIIPSGGRTQFAIGSDFSFWAGFLKLEGFDNSAYGFLAYPYIMAGYKFDDDLRFILKGEALMNVYQKFYAGDISIHRTPVLYSGEAITFSLEQPFYKKEYLNLGFRIMYSNFYWQTWSLFETFDRNIFYPEFIIGFYL